MVSLSKSGVIGDRTVEAAPFLAPRPDVTDCIPSIVRGVYHSS